MKTITRSKTNHDSVWVKVIEPTSKSYVRLGITRNGATVNKSIANNLTAENKEKMNSVYANVVKIFKTESKTISYADLVKMIEEKYSNVEI